MSADKRQVATDALETLGTIIGPAEKRDAIHLAVEPVEAGEFLYPGQNVGLINGKAFASGCKHLGIVDPFLKGDVQPGQRFWFVVYPRQISSLRHVWEHPDFPASGETGVAPSEIPAASSLPSLEIRSRASDRRSESEEWIRGFAASIPLDYDILMDGARQYVESRRRGGWGEYLNFGSLLEGEYVPDEFWPHYEAVTGESVEEGHRGSFFTCSC